MLILNEIVFPYVISLIEQVYAMTKADPNAGKCLWQMPLAQLRHTRSDFGEKLLPFAGLLFLETLLIQILNQEGT